MTKLRMMRMLSAAVAFAWLLFSGVAVPAMAQGEVTVSINAPAEVTSGGNFTATVNITRVVNFDAANYDVSFNSAVLRLDGVTSGQIGSTTIPVDIWNQRELGRFTIAVNIPGLTGATGSGYLAVLHFTALGSSGQSSNISLSNGTLSSTLAEAIPATWAGDLLGVISGGSGNQVLPPAPASFSISGVLVTPPAVKPDEPVTVSVLVTNTGGSAGSYTVVLKVNGAREAAKEVVLGAGNIDTVSFPIVKSTAGIYVVDMNGMSSQFTVTALSTSLPPLPPTESPAPPAPEAPKEIKVPEIPQPDKANPKLDSQLPVHPSTEAEAAPAPAPPPPPAVKIGQVNWLMVGGAIVGGIIVIGLFVVFRVSRRLY